jgi:2-succinyl-5-enolpyruvyl-6-hydroxy-3-cyclohexene-1-carboxylate synthase
VDVFARSIGTRPGPVQLNLAFREPLLGDAGEPPPRIDTRAIVTPTWGLLDEQLARLLPVFDRERGVIVAGTRAAADTNEASAILEFGAALGWPVLADAPSGCRVPHPALVTTFDSVLRVDAVAESLRPDVVLHLGGLLASRVTNEWLAAGPALHLGFDRHGVLPDPDGVLADGFQVSPAVAVSQLAPLVERRGSVDRDRGDADRWRRLEAEGRRAIDDLLTGDGARSEPAVAARLLASLPEGAVLVASSSMPVRDLEWYAPARAGVRVVANRGANGIDGVTSTAVGVALSGVRTACLIGDVAFVHDTNALVGLGGRDVDLLVVVIDNDGGGIFSFLPQATELDGGRFEQLFGTPHGTDLAALCRAHHLDVAQPDDVDSFGRAVDEWCSGGGTRIVILRSDRANNRDVHAGLNAAVAACVVA